MKTYKNSNDKEKLKKELQKLTDKCIRDAKKHEEISDDDLFTPFDIEDICEKCLCTEEDLETAYPRNTFLARYEKEYCDLLRRYILDTTAVTSKKLTEVLSEMSKKLTNLSKSNRLLWFPKLPAKFGTDLFDTTGSYTVEDLLFPKKTREVTVSLFSDEFLPKNQPAYHRSKNIRTLYREILRTKREGGDGEVYIAYPFVQGELNRGEFPIRAPLCLFPVVLKKGENAFTVTPDASRDVLYNSVLLMANAKFNNTDMELPDCTLEDIKGEKFFETLTAFYRENGINLTVKNREWKKFTEYSGDNAFPKYEKGVLEVIPEMILGKFPAFSSPIQKDFDKLIRRGAVNQLVADLISDYGKGDLFSDNDAKLELNTPENGILPIREADLTYTHPLNSSQEAVLTAIKDQNELVIEGPPGTGKSQTITNLITSFVDRGQTVLMVSEKKTALDVVYSRLGDLSRYAILLDNGGDKSGFYGQVEKMIYSPDKNIPLEQPDLSQLSKEVDMDVAQLEKIAELLFKPDDFGVAPYRLYMENRRIHLELHDEMKTYKTIRNFISAELLKLTYDQIYLIHRKFSSAVLTENLDLYQLTVERYPWLLQMREDLTEYNLVMLSDAINNFIPQVDDWKGKSALSRLTSKKKLSQDIEKEVKPYFQKGAVDYAVRLVFEQPEAFKQSLTEYTSNYVNLKPQVLSVTKAEKEYLSTLRKIHKVCGGAMTDWNDEVYNTLLFEHIQQFELKNRSLFPTLSGFEKIIDDMDKKIEEKRANTTTRIAWTLTNALRKGMLESANYRPMFQALNSRRRKSVSRFMEDYWETMLSGIRIWLMTPETVSEILPLKAELFDLVIFDEASQMYAERSIPAIYRGKKVVVAGDHKQLRPSSLGDGRYLTDEMLDEEEEDVPLALEEESLLDLARFRYPDVMLNTHYRSRYEELIDFSNYAFYKGRLFVSPNTENPQTPPIQVTEVKNALWENRTNRKEAEVVANLVAKLLLERKQRETIGVIAFNIAQKDLICDLLDEKAEQDKVFGKLYAAELQRKENGEDMGLFVKNIEQVQGDERDIIVFSLGYAHNKAGKMVHNFGWLNQQGGENRLNVAISRAKKKIHIVTSFRPSELDVDEGKSFGPRYLKKYLEYAVAVSSGDKESAQLVLKSFGETYFREPPEIETAFARQIADRLRKKGYEIDTQVGIGGYRIDIAVKKYGRYVLGIECDGKLYAVPAPTRERDYHRNQYMESRGWTMQRVWSCDFWRDPDKEIEKLCRLIDRL